MTLVNPDEGQVAIPSKRAGGHVVGRLGARAMRWVEEKTGKRIDTIYGDFAQLAATAAAEHKARQAGREPVFVESPGFAIGVASTVLWAAIEHERRVQKAPGPEFTLDDAEEIVDEIGIDDANSYALALIQLSLPFKKRTEQLEEAARQAGEESPLDPLRRVAAGIGNGTSPPPSDPVSISNGSGSGPLASSATS